MPPRYKSVKECRDDLQDYIAELEVGTDDNDEDKRVEWSTQRYKQDLRWYDHWLDEQNIDSPQDVTVRETSRLGRQLSEEFSGTTPLYRWDRIYAFHEWLVALEATDRNPMQRWDKKKDEKWGMTKKSQQSKELEEGEDYATSQEEVRLMEENVGRNRIRDQSVIRLLWQTGMRRGEASGLNINDIDREAREIFIRSSNAKNGKKRYVAYQESLNTLLDRWLSRNGPRDEMLGVVRDNDGEIVDGDEEDYTQALFVGERGARLSPERINEIVIDAADDAELNRKMYADANAPEPEDDSDPEPNRNLITAHSLRHGYGTYMVNTAPQIIDGENGQARLWEVSRQMGHSSTAITEEIYVEDDPRAGIEYAHTHGPE